MRRLVPRLHKARPPHNPGSGAHANAPVDAPPVPAHVAKMIESVPLWYHQIEVAPGVVTPGIHECAEILAMLPLPEDATGLRVLDLGTRDGFFAFEMERRGAEVVAIDYMPIEQTGFTVAKQLLGARVEYSNGNVYDLSPERYGEFDIVLLLGVLYHLRDPMLALDRIWSVCRGELIIETHVVDEAVLLSDGSFTTLEALSKRLTDVPLMQFYPGRSLNDDYSNWWGPNMICLRRMLEATGFRVEHLSRRDTQRAVARAVKVEDEQVLYHSVIEKASNVVDDWDSFVRQREHDPR